MNNDDKWIEAAAKAWMDSQRKVWLGYTGSSELAAALPAAFDADERLLAELIRAHCQAAHPEVAGRGDQR